MRYYGRERRNIHTEKTQLIGQSLIRLTKRQSYTKTWQWKVLFCAIVISIWY